MADPYGVNPLVDELAETNPAVHQMAMGEAPPPTLFASGDLPPFTASGIDPQVLMKLPYTLRHAAAAESDPAAVLGILEEYASDPMFTLEHSGLDDYRNRVHRWAAGLDKPAVTMTTEEEDELLAGLFGDG